MSAAEQHEAPGIEDTPVPIYLDGTEAATLLSFIRTFNSFLRINANSADILDAIKYATPLLLEVTGILLVALTSRKQAIPNEGVSKAFRSAFRTRRNDFIGLQEVDDIWPTDLDYVELHPQDRLTLLFNLCDWILSSNELYTSAVHASMRIGLPGAPRYLDGDGDLFVQFDPVATNSKTGEKFYYLDIAPKGPCFVMFSSLNGEVTIACDDYESYTSLRLSWNENQDVDTEMFYEVVSGPLERKRKRYWYMSQLEVGGIARTRPKRVRGSRTSPRYNFDDDFEDPPAETTRDDDYI